jgi:hypothetical protein
MRRPVVEAEIATGFWMFPVIRAGFYSPYEDVKNRMWLPRDGASLRSARSPYSLFTLAAVVDLPKALKESTLYTSDNQGENLPSMVADPRI